MYRRIVSEFIRNPRDVCTVPIKSENRKWFYVFVENNCLYVEAARISVPKSVVKKRMLPETECNDILAIYHRRCAGEQVSAEAQACTRSQVYWYGIFAELGL